MNMTTAPSNETRTGNPVFSEKTTRRGTHRFERHQDDVGRRGLGQGDRRPDGIDRRRGMGLGIGNRIGRR